MEGEIEVEVVVMVLVVLPSLMSLFCCSRGDKVFSFVKHVTAKLESCD